MNGAGNAAPAAASSRLRWRPIAACRSAGSVDSEFVEHPAQPPDHLRRVGTVTDDLSQREHEQGVEVPQLALEPHRAAGIHPQAGRVGPAAGDGEEVADAIDGLDPCRGVVDGRRQRADRDIGKLPEAERRILYERAFAANEEEPGDITLAQVPAVHQRDGGAVRQVFAYPDGQLEPALLLPAQFDQAVQVGSRDDPGWPGVAQTARRGICQRRLGVYVGRRRREVLLDGRRLSVAIVSTRYWTRMSRTTPCR